MIFSQFPQDETSRRIHKTAEGFAALGFGGMAAQLIVSEAIFQGLHGKKKESAKHVEALKPRKFIVIPDERYMQRLKSILLRRPAPTITVEVK